MRDAKAARLRMRMHIPDVQPVIFFAAQIYRLHQLGTKPPCSRGFWVGNAVCLLDAALLVEVGLFGRICLPEPLERNWGFCGSSVSLLDSTVTIKLC